MVGGKGTGRLGEAEWHGQGATLPEVSLHAQCVIGRERCLGMKCRMQTGAKAIGSGQWEVKARLMAAEPEGKRGRRGMNGWGMMNDT